MVDLADAPINMTLLRRAQSSLPKLTPGLRTHPACLHCRDAARAELLSTLDSVRGKKALVIDPALAGSLTVMVQTSTLKARGTGACLLPRLTRDACRLSTLHVPTSHTRFAPPPCAVFRSTAWTSCSIWSPTR